MLRLLIFFSLLLSPALAHALRDLEGARSIGMAGALRASAAGGAAPQLNPAGMVLGRTYVISGAYQFRSGDSASLSSVSIVDSMTAKVAAGLYYNFGRGTIDQTAAGPEGNLAVEQTQTSHETGLSLAVPFGSSVLFGVTTKYINHSSDLKGELPVQITGVDLSRFTMDIGTIVAFSQLRLAVVGYNLVSVGDPRFSRALAMAASYQIGATLLVEFDTVLDFDVDPDTTRASLHGGAEVFLGQHYALRTGVVHDTALNATSLAWGLGLMSRRMALELGLRQQVDGGKQTLFVTSLQLFLR